VRKYVDQANRVWRSLVFGHDARAPLHPNVFIGSRTAFGLHSDHQFSSRSIKPACGLDSRGLSGLQICRNYGVTGRLGASDNGESAVAHGNENAVGGSRVNSASSPVDDATVVASQPYSRAGRPNRHHAPAPVARDRDSLRSAGFGGASWPVMPRPAPTLERPAYARCPPCSAELGANTYLPRRELIGRRTS
jgi:hypothetical protein